MAIIIHTSSVKRGKKITGSSSQAPKDPISENSESPHLVQFDEHLRDNSGIGDDEVDEQIYEEDDDDVGEEDEVPDYSNDSLRYDEDDEEEGAEMEVGNNESQIVRYESETEEEEEEVEVEVEYEVEVEDEEEERLGLVIGNEEEDENVVYIEGQFYEEGVDNYMGINEQIENAFEEDFDGWDEDDDGSVVDNEEEEDDGSVAINEELNNEAQFDDEAKSGYRKRGLPVDFNAHLSHKRRRYTN